MNAQPVNHISIDFSSGGIRLIELANNEVVFFSFLGEEITPNTFTYISNLRENSTAIVEYLKRIEYPTRTVSYTLPQSVFLTQLIDIPMVSEAEVPEAIYWRLSTLLPEEIDSYFKDFLIVHTDVKTKQYHILTFAIKREYVLVMSNILAKVGLTPVFLEPPSLALHRLIMQFYAPQAGAFLNIGSTETTIGIFTKDSVLYSQIVPKGTDIVKDIFAQQLQIAPKDLKEKLPLIKNIPQDVYNQITREFVTPIANELVRIRAFLQQTLNKDIALPNIFISSQNAWLYSLVSETVTATLNKQAKVTIVNPNEFLKVPQNLKNILDSSYSVVTGLNLRKEL